MSLAFPAAAAQTVALNDMRGQKVRWPLTVAGTAQAGRVAALPVYRLTAQSSARAGTKRAHTIARLESREAAQGLLHGRFLDVDGRRAYTRTHSGARMHALCMQLNGKQGASPARIGPTCAAPATVSEGIA